jgi:NhaP-type Na+/H+ or K+/H+ antiporter
MPTYAIWQTVGFALNILAFIFIGLQIRPILERAWKQRTGRDTLASPVRSCGPLSSRASPGTCPSIYSSTAVFRLKSVQAGYPSKGDEPM